MRSQALSINDVKVYIGPVELVCYGLGSCIGLFITDRLRNISGCAHIPLPWGEGSADMRGADEMLPELLDAFRSHGSDCLNLRAKIVGGAQIIPLMPSAGDSNTQTVLDFLRAQKIYIAAIDTGGRVSRTARFNSTTQMLTISTSDHKTYAI
ncbi:MAG TPA: chemotaxis protein CheD [Ohtaekwangia sp.]|uniref:chemotaxis protein CheD n=1 Tax=Ohtaekwangia sp. TaxID=2066019 RepID=UPI002F928D1A